jgi:hypothetical protein
MGLPIIGAIAGAATGIFGAINGKRASDRQASDQNRINRLQAKYGFQQQVREYGSQVSNLKNQRAFAKAQAKQEIAVAKAVANQEWQFNNAVAKYNYTREKTNAELDWQYRTASQQMDWQLQQTLQAAEYRASMRAFEQSEITYANQINLNTQAANQAYEGEQYKITSIRQQIAMEAEGVRTTEMKQRGAIAATGRQGQSIGRLMQDASQQYATDVGILGMNLAYANTDFKMDMRDAWLAAQNANADAESNRMLRPMDMIDIPRPLDIPKAFIPKPLQTPRPIINKIKPLAPKRIIKPPKPVMTPVPIARGGSTGSLLGGIGTSVLGGIGTYQSLRPPSPTSTPIPANPYG